MSARAVQTHLPSQEIVTSIKADLAFQIEVSAVLYAINHRKNTGRILRQIVPGLTHDDAELLPGLLWQMFGMRGEKGKGLRVPLNPQFGYVDGFRQMSLAALQKVVGHKMKNHPSYKQLRRLFAGLKRAGLLTNIREANQDAASGAWTSTSGYRFNLDAWRKTLATCAKTPTLCQKKQPKAPTVVVQRPMQRNNGLLRMPGQVRVAAKKQAEVVADPLIFAGSPSAQSGRVESLKEGGANLEPGKHAMEAIQVSQPASQDLSLSLGAEDKGRPAAPPAASTSSLEDKIFRIRSVEQAEAKAETHQQFLFQHPEQAPQIWKLYLEASVTSRLGEGWKGNLPQDQQAGTHTLKPRVSDCVLVEPDPSSSVRAVIHNDGKLIHLSKEEVSLGDLVCRATCCPLRFQDWQTMVRLARRPDWHPNKLSRQRLALWLRSVLGIADLPQFHWMSGNSTKAFPIDYATVVPEVLQELSVADQAQLGFYTDRFTDAGYRTCLPALFADTAAPYSLLSGGNAGKLLFAWDGVWSLLRQTQGAKTDGGRPVLQRISAARPMEQVYEGEMGGLAGALDAVAWQVPKALKAGEALPACVEPLKLIQHLPNGVASVAPATQQKLQPVLQQLRDERPDAWLDLDVAMGDGVLAALMGDAAYLRAWDGVQDAARALLNNSWEVHYTEKRLLL